MTPIEKKIDLMLRGINLIMLNMDINRDLKSEFNLEFFNIYNNELKEEPCCEMPKDFVNESKEGEK